VSNKLKANVEEDEMGTERKALDYGAGALVVLVISIGAAIVVYSVGMVPSFNLLDLPTWVLGPLGVCTFIFGPLGVFTLIYSLIARKESTYYLVWGTIMVAVAMVSVFFNVISPFIILGVLLVVIAVIGIIAYWRSRK